MNAQTVPPLSAAQKMLSFGICFAPHATIAVLFAMNIISERFFFGYGFLLNMLVFCVLIGLVFCAWCSFAERGIARITHSSSWDNTALGTAIGIVIMIIPVLASIIGPLFLLLQFLDWSTARSHDTNTISRIYCFMTESIDPQIPLALNFIISTAPAVALALYMLSDQRKHILANAQQALKQQERQENARQEPRCTVRAAMWLVDKDGEPIGGRKFMNVYDQLCMMPDGTFLGKKDKKIYTIDQNGSVLQELSEE